MQQFECIKQTFGDSAVRSAQALCKELKCCNYAEFLTHVQKWIQNCIENWYDGGIHFTATEQDYQLSQYACYLVVEKMLMTDTEYHKQIKNYFYTKDFPWWNIDKQNVDGGRYEPAKWERWAKEREIWNTKWWVNVWSETDGKWKYLRPVLILKTIWRLYLVAPLTTKGKEWDHPAAHLYHKLTSVTFIKDNIEYESFIMLNQIKVIDKKRCIRNLKMISKEEFKDIKNLLRDMYLPEDSS